MRDTHNANGVALSSPSQEELDAKEESWDDEPLPVVGPKESLAVYKHKDLEHNEQIVEAHELFPVVPTNARDSGAVHQLYHDQQEHSIHPDLNSKVLVHIPTDDEIV